VNQSWLIAASGASGVTVDADASTAIPVQWAYTLGIVCFAIALIAVAVVSYTFRELLKTQLQRHESVRALAAGMAGLATFISSLFVEWIGFSDIRNGKGDLNDLFLFTLTIFIASCGFASTIAIAWLTDRLNLDLRGLLEENRQAVEANEELRKSIVTEKAYTSLAIKVSLIFLDVVTAKKNKAVELVKAAKRDNKTIQLSDLRQHMDPEKQMVRIIETICSILKVKLEDKPLASLRVALFSASGDHFSVVYSLNDRGHIDCVTGPSEPNRHFFHLKDGTSLAAKAARAGRVMLVSDTKEPNTDFAHFGDKGRDHIRSIACLPIGTLGKQCQHVLSIDCDLPNFFADTENERSWLEIMQRNAETRLIYEFEMDKLLPHGTVTNSHALQGMHNANKVAKSNANPKNSKRS
jgi:putative methionine-R-sulfoxide reductase with GAF domain